MLITEKFCWGHLGKTGGNSTKCMFDVLGFKDVVLRYENDDPRKHFSFIRFPDLCVGKKKILNIRRLPTWLISDWNHGYVHRVPEWDKEAIVEGMICVNRTGPNGEIKKMNALADLALKTHFSEELGGIDFWIRTENLPEDFINVVGNIVDISEDNKKKIRGIWENKAGKYFGSSMDEVLGWFSKDEIRHMYEKCPFWAQIEMQVYGNLMC